MKTFFTFLLAGAFSTVFAQTPQAPVVQPYGKVDMADLVLKSCDFEKDANAEVLFEKGNLSYSVDITSLTLETHRRIKILTKRETNLQTFTSGIMQGITWKILPD